MSDVRGCRLTTGSRSLLRNGLVVLVAVALASLGAAMRPAIVVADDSLSMQEMCGLFPTDMGLSPTAESEVVCTGWRGSLDREQEEGTWLLGSIRASGSAAEARAELDDSGVPTSWTPVSGLGDVAFEIYLSEFNMYVVRDRYILYVQAATSLTDEAKRLMVHLDRELAAVLARTPAGSGADAPGGRDGKDGDDRPIDYVGVFFGTSGLKGLKELIEAGTDTYAACETMGDCSGNEQAWLIFRSLYSRFGREYENPSDRDMQRVTALAVALGMSEIVGKDCEALFPSVATAFPVIERLAIYGAAFYQPPEGDPIPVASRLIELLAAQDAAGWEKRFPPNHASIDWPPCDAVDGGSG